MAWVKLCDKEGNKAEFQVSLYEENSEIKKSGNQYSYKNGLLTQTIELENIPGEHTKSFPVSFKKSVHGCFVTKAPDALEHRIYIVRTTLDSVTVHIPANPCSPTEKIVLSATGY